MSLSPKREAFAQSISSGMTQSDAYRSAFSCANQKEATIWNNAYKLMQNSEVMARIDELRSDAMKRTEISRDRVLTEIARLALSDPRKAFTANGDLLPIQQWPDEVAAAISSIKITAITGADGVSMGELKEVKFWDKNSAADKLCKFLGLYETDNRQKSPLDDLSRDTLRLIKEKLGVKR